jgi:hypothetical protein
MVKSHEFIWILWFFVMVQIPLNRCCVAPLLMVFFPIIYRYHIFRCFDGGWKEPGFVRARRRCRGDRAAARSFFWDLLKPAKSGIWAMNIWILMDFYMILLLQKNNLLHDVTHDHWNVNDFRYQWTLEFSHEPVNISLLIGQYRGLYWGGVLQIMISNN